MTEEISLLQQRIAQIEAERMALFYDYTVQSPEELQRRNQQLETLLQHYTIELQKTLLQVQIEIEKRKQIERELKQYQQQEKHTLDQERDLIHLKARFIEMASHEFRTPLAVIASSAGILKEFGYALSEEKRQHHLQCIQTYLKHTTQLLDDILLLNQAEVGQLAFEPSLLNLTEFCQSIIQEWQLNSPDHIFKVQLSEVLKAHMDQKLLRQIFSNLFSNATKFSAKGSIISFQLSPDRQLAVFKVEDQGIGIPREDQAQLFQAFHRARNVGAIPGRGLGLSIVKKCTELHGGQVTLASAIDVGTTCVIKIPIHSIKPD